MSTPLGGGQAYRRQMTIRVVAGVSIQKQDALYSVYEPRKAAPVTELVFATLIGVYIVQSPRVWAVNPS